jgi:hypothetical protein
LDKEMPERHGYGARGNEQQDDEDLLPEFFLPTSFFLVA